MNEILTEYQRLWLFAGGVHYYVMASSVVKQKKNRYDYFLLRIQETKSQAFYTTLLL